MRLTLETDDGVLACVMSRRDRPAPLYTSHRSGSGTRFVVRPLCFAPMVAVGWPVAILAWVLHVGALALAPLSIVQAVLSGGLVFRAVLAERFFGFSSDDGNGSG